MLFYLRTSQSTILPGAKPHLCPAKPCHRLLKLLGKAQERPNGPRYPAMHVEQRALKTALLWVGKWDRAATQYRYMQFLHGEMSAHLRKVTMRVLACTFAL